MRSGWLMTLSLSLMVPAIAAAAPAAPAVEIPLRFVDKSPPLVTVHIQGRDIPLWIDLGAATPLTLHPALLSQLATAPTGRSSTGFGMEGTVYTVPIVTLARADLGGRVFTGLSTIPDSHDAEYLDKQMPPGQGSLGAGFFAGYRVAFDYARRRLTLVPADAPAAAQRACRGHPIPLVQDPAITWGLVTRTVTDTGELLFVWDTGTPGLVMPKTSAQAAGLDASGATLTLSQARMNGRDFGPLQFEVWDVPAAPAGLAGFIGYDFFAAHRVCVDFPGQRLIIR